jgi:heat shock protein HslJ
MKIPFFSPVVSAFALLVMLSPVPGSTESSASIEGIHNLKLEGTNWLVEAIDGGSVMEDVQPTVKFGKEGRVSGSTGCNLFSGAFTEENDQIQFGPLASTRRACPPKVMSQERLFLEAMAAVRSFSVDKNGLLHLTDTEGGELLRLSPVSGSVKKESSTE